MDRRGRRATLSRTHRRAVVEQGIIGVYANRRDGAPHRNAVSSDHFSFITSVINIETLTIRWLEMAATGDCQFASMNWPRRRQVAGIKMERVDANHSSVELDIGLQEFAERLSGDIAATRHRDVRMPGAKLRFDTGSQRGFLHALVNLE